MRRSARAGPAALGVAGVNAIEKIAVALLWQAQEAALYQNLVPSTGIESKHSCGFQAHVRDLRGFSVNKGPHFGAQPQPISRC